MRKVATPQPLSTAWLIGCAGLCLFLSGCFAQRAELAELEQVYGGKLVSLDKQNKNLLAEMREVEERIDQQEQVLTDKLNRLVRESHARLNQKLADFREQDLRSVQDGMERTGYRLDSIRTRLDDMEHKTKSWLGVIEKVQSDHADVIKKDRDQFQRELQADREQFQKELRTVSETITAMAQSLDTRLEEQATSTSEGEARNRAMMIDQRGHLEEVNRRFDTVAEALESVTEAFTERVENQDQYLDKLSKAVQATNEQLTMLRREKAGSASVRQVEHSLEALLSEQDRYLDKLGKAVEAINAQVVTLNETMAPASALRSVQETVTVRVDDQARYLDELAKAVEAVSSQMVTLNDQMASSVQTIDDRLASLTREINGLREAQNAAGANGPGMPSKESVPEQGTKLTPTAGVATRDAADGSAAQSDTSVYEQHMQKLKQGDLDGALQGFAEFLHRYPSSPLLPNAQYWLGECYYGKKDFKEAIDAFEQVSLAYPTSHKVSAALLKKGYAHLALNDSTRAVSALKQVVDEYPKSPEASKALAKLTELNQAQ